MAQKLAPAPTAAEPTASASQDEAPAAFSYETASAVQRGAMRPGPREEAQDEAQVEAQGSGQTPNPSCETTKPVTDFLCQEHQKRTRSTRSTSSSSRSSHRGVNAARSWIPSAVSRSPTSFSEPSKPAPPRSLCSCSSKRSPSLSSSASVKRAR